MVRFSGCANGNIQVKSEKSGVLLKADSAISDIVIDKCTSESVVTEKVEREVHELLIEKTKNSLGDLDGNGNVDNADLVTLARAMVGLTELTDAQTAVADMNGDTNIDNSDLVTLARKIVGL